MKKVIALATMACLPFTYASAEGYQINTQSTKQAGMGHTGVALKLGAESMHFNPAGMAFMKNSIDMSAGVIGVFATSKFKDGGYSHTTDNDPSTPIYAYAAFKVYDNLAVGMSVNNPYGSGINWGKDWKGSHLIQNISLKTFNVQPTVSWKITNNLSVGAGLMMMFGDIDLNKALIGPGEMSALMDNKTLQGALGQIVTAHPEYMSAITELKSDMAKFDDIAAASVNINGKANLRLGFNVGAMYDINDKWTIGASYRSKVKAKVKEGDVSLTYPNEALLKKILGSINSFGSMLGMSSISLPDFNNATFSAELPLPSNFNIGVSYKPNNRWIVTGEVDFVGWGAYNVLNINFQPSAELREYDINATKDYRNTRIYRIGTQYATTKRLDLRFGAYVDESPVKDNYLNPETPSMTKLGISAGLSFRPVNRLSVDFSFTYVTGFGREGSYTDQSIFLKKMDSVPSEEKLRTFGGHYDVTALMPAIGLSYAF